MIWTRSQVRDWNLEIAERFASTAKIYYYIMDDVPYISHGITGLIRYGGLTTQHAYNLSKTELLKLIKINPGPLFIDYSIWNTCSCEIYNFYNWINFSTFMEVLRSAFSIQIPLIYEIDYQYRARWRVRI